MPLQYAEPQLKGTMLGTEASLSSKLIARATPAPRFHHYLTVKFASFPEAASYTKALQRRCFRRGGGVAEVIHTGAQQQRPPQANWRGVTLALLCHELRRC